MGIFGKGKDSDEDSVDSIEQNTSSQEADFDNRASETNTAGLNYKSATSNPMNYGIQDAIELIRQLPNVDSDVIIAVVRKTLESTKIHVAEIIADAQKREQAIGSRTTALTSKIDNLQNQIAELNKEIKQLNSDLKETTRVKGLLMGSVEHEQKSSTKIEPSMRKPVPPAKETDTRASEQSTNAAENSADKLPVSWFTS